MHAPNARTLAGGTILYVAAAAAGQPSGPIVGWGSNSFGQITVPPPNAGFTAVAAGPWHSLGLRSDGTIAAWGKNWSGQCDVPAPNADFVAIAAGGVPFIPHQRHSHSLGLKNDGSIVVWGDTPGLSNLPQPNSGFVAIATRARLLRSSMSRTSPASCVASPPASPTPTATIVPGAFRPS